MEPTAMNCGRVTEPMLVLLCSRIYEVVRPLVTQEISLLLVTHYTSVLQLVLLTTEFGKRMEQQQAQHKSAIHVAIILIVDLLKWLNIMAVYMAQVMIGQPEMNSS